MSSIKTPNKRTNFLKATPIAKAIASKLITDPNRGRFVNVYADGSAAPPVRSLHNIAEKTALSIQDAENIFATLPDVELSMQILVSCVLSPNDMREPTLFWKTRPSKLDPELAGRILDYLKNHFESDYPILEILQPALEDVLFKTGSYPLAVVPESSIDDIINNRSGERQSKAALESMSSLLDSKKTTLKNTGYLGNGLFSTAKEKTKTNKSVGLESYFTEAPNKVTVNPEIYPGLYVCDDISLLKLPTAVEHIRHLRESEIVGSRINVSGLGLESRDAAEVQNLASNLYRHGSFMGQEMVKIRPAENSSRAAIGHPLVMHLPSESIIPVHVPSDVTKHVAYFVLVDEYGNPVSVKSDSKYYDELRSGNLSAGSRSAVSGLLNKANRISNGLKCQEDTTTMQLIQSYTQMVELDLLERLKNGIAGQAVEIERPEEVYRIMLARTLAGKRTQLLYIPISLMTYMAFDYNDYGIGRSLLEKSKLLASLRALLTFANTMAAIKNSTNRRELTINVDEDDPEPERTVEMVLTEYAKVQSQAIPLATTRPYDLVDGIRQANTSIKVTGTTALPELSLDANDTASQRVVVDSELMRQFREDHYRSLNLSPEMVDTTVNVEYAATVITSNQLMNKRLAIYQKKTCRFIADHVGKYVINSGKICADLIKIIKEYSTKTETTKDKVADIKETIAENKGTGLEASIMYEGGKIAFVQKESVKEAEAPKPETVSLDFTSLLREFFGSLEITLPAPDTTRLDNQIEQFSKYEEALTKVLPYYINTNTISKIVGEEMADKMEDISEIIKSIFIRNYLAQNNILPELKALLGVGSNGDDQTLNIIDAHLTHSTDLSATIANLMLAIKEATTKSTTDDSGSSDFGSDDTTSGDSDFGNDDAFAEDSDFGDDTTATDDDADLLES